MGDYKIKKGYDIPILGRAEETITDLSKRPFIGVCPVEFKGIKPRLAVKVDDTVKVGTPLFHDKKTPDLQFASPASGRITAINYGPRRVIEEIIITCDDEPQYETVAALDLNGIAQLDRGDLVAKLLAGGMWPYVRQRPFNHIADPEATPKSIFVNAMDTAPLANDPGFSLQGQEAAFEAGLTALKVLSDKVFVCTAKPKPAVFGQVDGVSYHTFSGPHPAGLVGTHIGRLDPINKGEAVWYVNARDAVLLGRYLLDGKYPVERVLAVAGPGVKQPQYVRTQQGVKLGDVLNDNLEDGEMRIISGNVLMGDKKSADGFLGFYDDMITVLPEGREAEFLGWMMPGLNKPSFTNAYLSGFLNKRFKMTTNIQGGHRAIIQSGVYDEVVALDLFPEFLVKATLAEDIEQMEQLGILECDPEDFALATYVCPSKTEVSQIIANGLELMEKEG